MAASTVHKKIGVLSKSTWNQWARSRRRARNAADTGAITGNTRVALLKPFTAMENDAGMRRGPHPKSMGRKPGRKRMLHPSEVALNKNGIAHGSRRSQQTWAGPACKTCCCYTEHYAARWQLF